MGRKLLLLLFTVRARLITQSAKNGRLADRTSTHFPHGSRRIWYKNSLRSPLRYWRYWRKWWLPARHPWPSSLRNRRQKGRNPSHLLVPGLIALWRRGLSLFYRPILRIGLLLLVFGQKPVKSALRLHNLFLRLRLIGFPYSHLRLLW